MRFTRIHAISLRILTHWLISTPSITAARGFAPSQASQNASRWLPKPTAASSWSSSTKCCVTVATEHGLATTTAAMLRVGATSGASCAARRAASASGSSADERDPTTRIVVLLLATRAAARRLVVMVRSDVMVFVVFVCTVRRAPRTGVVLLATVRKDGVFALAPRRAA